MSANKLMQLVDRLIQKTNAGSLKWQDTANSDEYTTAFSLYSVTIAEVKLALPRVEKTGVRIVNKINYRIRLINSNGDVAEEFTNDDLQRSELAGKLVSPVTDKWAEKMKQLYEMARRSALGADVVLDAILKELE